MKKLLIVESPAKIKTISKFLGKDYKIMSTVGHIVDLPPKKIGVTITPKSIDIDYAVIEDKDKIIADICKEASTANEIYLAPDPDREGEIIAWHVEQAIKKVVKDKTKIHRITFNEITKDAILDAVKHGHDVDLKKVAAQQARRVLDRWVGYEVSPVLWKKLAPGLSAGRVQSVALRLIADREEAIRSFRPEEYWSITGEFAHIPLRLSGPSSSAGSGGQEKETFLAELTHIGKEKAEINNEKKANDIVAKLKKLTYIIDSITDKQRTKNPLPPFMTSSLQQAAFNQLGFSVKKTMQIAQKLYEGIPLEDKNTPVALITYMRTDSLRISDTALKQVRGYVSNNFSKEYVPSKSNTYSKKSQTAAQDAHEAIRPVDVNITPEQVTRYLTTKDNKDMARLYELIWRRFVACQMTPALYAQRQVVIKGDAYTFKVTGSTLIFDGFLKVYNAELDEKEEKVVIPKGLEAKAPVDLLKIDPKQHFTQPPPRFSEASLVKELEKEGIGRPSTYATILNTIQQRAYTTLDAKKRFTPTELGMAVTKMLVANLPDIMDLKFTAGMEEDLDKVAHGELERDKLLRDFYKGFSKEVEKFKGIEGHKRIAEPTDIVCPECKKHKLAIRFGKTGEFMGCLGYPECSFTSNFKRDEHGVLELVKAEAPKELNMNCPSCSKKLRQVVGKFGPFIACTGYPDCKYIHQNKASFKCPQCGEGDVVQRSWKGGKFWGCNRYPNCKFAVFGEIVETPCPQCKLPFLVKKVNKAGVVTLLCHDKKCGYKSSE